MRFHHLYFIRNRNEYRNVYIIKDKHGTYYRINDGKAHFDSATKYIATIQDKGWRKVTMKEFYLRQIRERRGEYEEGS